MVPYRGSGDAGVRTGRRTPRSDARHQTRDVGHPAFNPGITPTTRNHSDDEASGQLNGPLLLTVLVDMTTAYAHPLRCPTSPAFASAPGRPRGADPGEAGEALRVLYDEH